MATWQRSLRLVLVLSVLGIGAAVIIGLRDRSEPVRALVVERTDPEAVIETRGSRIIQADEFGENLRVVADRQDTYRDGALRLVDNVTVTVADRDDRAGFALSGDEAHLDAEKTRVQLIGGVRMESSDGLSAATEAATYHDANRVVSMPGRTMFSRDGMDAEGARAVYDRDSDVLRLLKAARVDLFSGAARTRIVSRRATLAQTDRYMRFDDDVTIDTGHEQMMASHARATLGDDGTRLQALTLRQGARIIARPEDDRSLRQMSANHIHLTYTDDGHTLDTAALTGDVAVDTLSRGGEAGSQISSRSMRLTFLPDSGEVDTLTAQDRVQLTLPEGSGGATRTVTSDQLLIRNTGGGGLDRAEFDGNVVFEETLRRDNGKTVVRVTRAEKLAATLVNGLTELSESHFVGAVSFEDGRVLGASDQAIYGVGEGRVELLTGGPEARVPRFEDQRGSVQARTITLELDTDHMEAVGDVESVLVSASNESDSDGGARRPGLLDADEPVYVTAGHLAYDSTTQTAVYTDDARLWQTDTEFSGARIVLDEANGNVTADGQVRTRTLITQVNDDTGLKEASMTTGRADSFRFEDSQHRATYTRDANVTGPRGDLTADLIHLILLADGRTLDRLEAMGNVELELEGRWVGGESLVYHDADGRYEMEGEPVQIIEEIDGECRETTGRTLIFFLTDDAVSIDGESKVRTETARGSCAEFTR